MDPGGHVTCWGINSNGECNAPKTIFTQISLASVDSCGLRPDGVIVCWGNMTSLNP
jgi:hypothetical protein